jgi:iron complex transport system substrate-binding protein
MKKIALLTFFLLTLTLVAFVGLVNPKVSATALASETRTITDLSGNKVKIPAAKDINRVIVASPPISSTFIDVTKDAGKLVGATARTFTWANPKVLDLIIPHWRKINTQFIKVNTCNVEEILKLHPDLIIVYGKEQSEGLENINIPVLNFYETNKDNETTTVNRDKFMREIFEIKDDNSLQKEWDRANKNIAASLAKVKGKKPLKGLMIMDNTGSKITVRGNNSYGDSWLSKSGLINVAKVVEGDGVEVSMEQIYQWNPDIIFLQNGLSEKQYLSNAIKGQDWSKIQAFKHKKIYYSPKGISGWAAPNTDSPLMAQWLITKIYPKTFSEKKFLGLLKDYYERRYRVKLSDQLATEIIYPNGR